MKRIKIILAAIALLGANATVLAQEAETQQSAATAEKNWTVTSQFDGLTFDLPAGLKTERGTSYTALSPDGTFGVTMTRVNHPSTKKIAFKLCERLADSMGMPRQLVKKMNYGKAKGAQAQGLIDGKNVTCIVLALDDYQEQIVVMADPSRADWMRLFLNTLRKSN